MSLSALMYLFKKSVDSSNDLVQIVDIGNDLYSTLSVSTRETFLLLTDLPAMVSFHEANYELQYSESYSGILNGQTCLVADYPYVMSLDAVLHSLLQENYNKFILTVGSYAVAIYILNNGVYKVFDSYSKNVIGQTDPFGTCTLLEIETLNELLYYFQQFHAQQSSFERRGIKILDIPINSEINDNSADVNNPFSNDESFVIALYSLCFSTVKSYFLCVTNFKIICILFFPSTFFI